MYDIRHAFQADREFEFVDNVADCQESWNSGRGGGAVKGAFQNLEMLQIRQQGQLSYGGVSIIRSVIFSV